jgi:amino acid transporter
VTSQALQQPIQESIGYTFKRLFLGKPLITEQLKSERLSNPVALGVLSPDAISSSAYGTEVILIELLPYAGLAAFVLLIPLTGVILFILILVAASYCQVVMTYTRAGGSYVVARENFGPRIAQIAAAALLIDYVVTVAVQAAAGTVAVVSAMRSLGPYSPEITVAIVVIMCYANLRGLREAGRPFAMPTYFFVIMMTLMIVTGVVREIFWGLPTYDAEHLAGAVPVHQADGLVMGATILVLLRAFANGGASLTGVEAISNTVGAFRKPQGVNARRVLTAMACILAFLLAGVAYLAHATHATPYVAGYPSVLSEIARAVFGTGVTGNVLYVLIQIATAAILFTGANTSFNGFPALANFVAEDRFLPRQLTKRGHRLVFSNGIIALTVLSVALVIGTGGSVNALVPFYAIGVFTGFAMAGYGMTKHHLTQKDPGWRYKLAINLSAGLISTVVVGIFAIAKFTEGAWLVVVPTAGIRADAAQPGIPRRGGDPGEVPHPAARLPEIRPAPRLRTRQLGRPRRAGGAALRTRSSCRRADRRPFHDRRRARRAAAEALGALRPGGAAAHHRLPRPAVDQGRTGTRQHHLCRVSQHQCDDAVAQAQLRPAARAAAA